MNEQIATLFIVFLYLLIAALIGRALMSWFPVSHDNQFARVLYQITEPLLEPVRRIIPRTGMIDFSTMVVIILLYVMIAVVQQAANA
ncbi:MAG: YggT family protein [Dehalococcoidia bacterium]|nr:YggT family protein [Dehalococcoidia bacterium]